MAAFDIPQNDNADITDEQLRATDMWRLSAVYESIPHFQRAIAQLTPPLDHDQMARDGFITEREAFAMKLMGRVVREYKRRERIVQEHDAAAKKKEEK